MPLSDDQKAMLRLLARDQSYEDIAALMGLSVDEVVSRAQGAVAQLESEGIPAPALPAGGGAAAPSPPEPVAKPPPAPVAKEPEPVPAAPAVSSPAPPPKPQPRKPRDNGMLLAIGGGVLAVVVIVVLAVLLISNSGGEDSPSAGSGGDGTTVADGSASREPTTAQLSAVDGSDASGEAEFGRVEESLALGIKAEQMEPTARGEVYMVWLAQSPRRMLPLTALVVPKNGRIDASYSVPTEAVVYLAGGDFDDLVITRAQNAELKASLERANSKKGFPTYSGDPVLAGQISGPIVGAAKRLEDAEK